MNESRHIPSRRGWSLTIFAFLLVALGLWGTVDLGWWAKSIWASRDAGVSYRFTVSLILVLGMACFLLGIPLLVLLLLPLAMFVGIAGLGPVAAVVWYWICATLIGAALLDWCKDKSLTIWSVRNSGAGFVVTGTIIGLMSHFPINTPILYFTLISGAALMSGWRLGLFKADRTIIKINFHLQCRRRGIQEACLLAIILVGVMLVLFVTMLPELGHDAISMHLNILVRTLEAKRWHFDVTQHIGAVMPMGSNWLMLPPYFFAGEHAAKLMNSSFVLATAWLSYRILSPRVGTTLALAAPAILLTLPLTMWVSGTVFVEPIIAFLCMLCLSELTGSADKARGGWLYLAAVAAYLCSSKLLGLPLIPILIVASYILSRQGKFAIPSMRTLALAAGIFLLISSQPYLVAYLKTGSPLFPFYNTFFKSPYFATNSLFNNGHAFANPLYLHPLSWEMLWNSSLKSKSYGEFWADGAIGIAFLVLIPLAIAASMLVRQWWILAGLFATMMYCGLVFQNQAYLRYVYQVLPWFIVFGVWALAQLRRPALTVTLLVLLMCVLSLLRFPVVYSMFGQFSTNLIFDREMHRVLLEKSNPLAIVGDVIRKMENTRNKQVLLIGTDPAYSHFPAGTIAWSWHSWPFSLSVGRGVNLKGLLQEFNVELIVHPVGSNQSHESDILSITDEVLRLNGIRVGLVKTQEIYETERVVGSSLATPSASWQLGGNVVRSEGVFVTVSNPITQIIDVKGRRGLLRMEVSCPRGNSFRSQINWLGERQEMNGTSIEVHGCHGDKTIIERIVEIPKSVSQGILYGTSHDEKPVLIRKVSFRTAY